MSNGKFGCHVGKRITSCFARQGAGPRKSCVNFDDAIVQGVWIERILNIAFADDSEVAYGPDCYGPQHLIFRIVQRLGRSDNYGVPGVDSHRINVFHVANGDTVVTSISDNFVFNFLPATQVFFDKYLSCVTRKRSCQGIIDFRWEADHSTSFATQCVGDPEHDG